MKHTHIHTLLLLDIRSLSLSTKYKVQKVNLRWAKTIVTKINQLRKER